MIKSIELINPFDKEYLILLLDKLVKYQNQTRKLNSILIIF